MTRFSENAPTGGEIHPVFIEQARAVLHPDDFGQLEALREPGTTFSFIRPFIEPDAADVRQMLDACKAALSEHPNHGDWQEAHVRALGFVGVNIFEEGRPSSAKPEMVRGIDNYRFAVHLCAALPQSAAETTEGTVTKVHTGSFRNVTFGVAVGITGSAATAEYNAAEDTAYAALGRPRPETEKNVEWARTRIAQLYRPNRRGFVPIAEMAEGVDLALPRRRHVELERVRLIVHQPGELYEQVAA